MAEANGGGAQTHGTRDLKRDGKNARTRERRDAEGERGHARGV